jgi:hypothetical protein
MERSGFVGCNDRLYQAIPGVFGNLWPTLAKAPPSVNRTLGLFPLDEAGEVDTIRAVSGQQQLTAN